MSRKQFLSLAVKLIILSATLIVGISILVWYPSILHIQREEFNKNIDFAESQMEFMERALYYGMLTNNREFIQQTVESIATAENILWINITDANGVVRISSRKGEFSTTHLSSSGGSSERESSGNANNEKRAWTLRETNGKRVLVMTEPIHNMQSCQTASCHFHSKDLRVLGKLESGFSMQSVDTYIKKQGFTVAAFGFFFIVVLSFPLYLVVHRFVLKPVSILTDGIQRVAGGDLSHTVEIISKDEFGMLAESFNSMTKKLQERSNAVTKELDEYRTSLLHAQKMEAIGTMSAGIAHDFNNILTGIIGYSELALDEKLDPAVEEHVSRVLELTQKATEFTKQILLIGRKVPPTRKPVDINKFIEDSMKMLRHMVEENIEIKLSKQDNLHMVDVDQSQMTQMLMNLVLNARDAMPKGGVIEVKTGETYVDEEYCRYYASAHPGKYIVISVSDNGEGIQDEIKDRVFEPFFTTKTKGKGTGLGLAVTYSIVKAHGGWINLYSEIGWGTEFKVYLPIYTIKSDAVSVDEAESEREALPGGTEGILLVDDEEVIRELGTSILIRRGYKVITAFNGEEAVRIYKERCDEISLVIMDRIMPGIGGIEAYNLLREINPGVKVIISSGYAADEMLSLMESGVIGFLDKPYRMADMAKAVRKAIDENPLILPL